MELDKSKKKADMQGHTTRADGVRLHLLYVDIHFVCVCLLFDESNYSSGIQCRTPMVEVILDELTYNKEILCQFLQVFIQSVLSLLLAPSLHSICNTQAFQQTFVQTVVLVSSNNSARIKENEYLR